jgi:hypothetical protein
MGKSRKRNAWCALRAPGAFAAVLLLHFSSVHAADPAAHVYLPSVVQGEVEFELNGGYQQWPGNSDNGERQLIYEAGSV